MSVLILSFFQLSASTEGLTPTQGIALTLACSLASGGLVGVVMKYRNDGRRIDLVEHDAERARMDAEWERIGRVAEGLRQDVDRQLEACKHENERIAQEAAALRKDVQQKGDEINELRRSYRSLADQFLVLRRQVGEVAEGTPRVERTRVTDFLEDHLLDPPIDG